MNKIRIFPAIILLSLVSGGCAHEQAGAKAPAVSAAAASASAKPAPGVVFLFPVANGTLPKDRNLMPGASRDYRGGVHQGVDIYYHSGDSLVVCGDQVLNAAEGWVVRADTAWKVMTEKEYISDTQRLKKDPDETLLDRLRGRQVWIRTADGITIRYCHLYSVAPGIESGIRVSSGVMVGTIGNSGTADGSRIVARNCHLHLEIWMPDGKFLGDGLTERETRDTWNALFGITAPAK